MTAALAGIFSYLAIGILGIVFGRGRIAALLSLGAGIVSLALWAPAFPETLVGGPPFGIAVAGDLWALGIWGLGLVLHLAVLVHGWHKDELFHALVTVLLGTCLAGGISRDLFNLYVILELSSLLSVILVAKEGRSPAVWAAVRYLVLAGVGMAVYLFGFGLIYGRTGLLAVGALSHCNFSDSTLRIGAGLLLAGAAIKTGVFLLGLWLPPAHGQAPTEVSALLSGLVVKLGILTMARLSEAFPVGPVLLVLGVLTAVGGVLYALWEPDLKLLLGHSTVSQLGYILLGLGLGMREEAILYAVAHGLFKGLLFLAAGQAVETTGQRTLDKLRQGIPQAAVLGLALGTWAIVGLPPLAGFSAKGALAVEAPDWARAVLMILTAGTAAYFSRLFPIFRPQPGGRVSGLALLSAGVATLGAYGIFRIPELRSFWAWVEPFLLAALGYAVYLSLAQVRLRLPRLTLDRVLSATLLSSVVLALLTLFL